MQLETLRDLYENGSMMTPGTTFEYRGYTLKKAGGGVGNVDHSEYMVLNSDGRKVESFTVNAFDSFGAFKQRLDEVVDYDPEDMNDWLSR